MSDEPERLTAELRTTLARLHAELARSSSVDAELRRLLQELATDLERLVPGSPDSAAPASTAPAAAAVPASAAPAPRLEALAVRFEADHPSLAGILRQLLDLLGRAGL